MGVGCIQALNHTDVPMVKVKESVDFPIGNEYGMVFFTLSLGTKGKLEPIRDGS